MTERIGSDPGKKKIVYNEIGEEILKDTSITEEKRLAELAILGYEAGEVDDGSEK